ncbi:hypothetical protein CW736_11470 [Nonlabens sp. MB-3u-79]|uniref:hypothetical protein n=1 Tax=Nonlabens sp. MB-3u-79 TaxID=2058134 RepID=UPI000C305A85|nr:hypothetical protein [Nonlabens sp. MB-3u-79]AUC79943.1 hypothetical protein CW736_11470 [Nonlabens sp. MB-3u-79]
MSKRKKINFIKLIFVSLILSGCEGFVGENGVVLDIETGERISNVKVKLETSNVNGITDSTNKNGYFETSTLVGCVFGGCDEYQLVFEKDGYSTKKIDENYRRNSSTKFIEESDTLIIELKRN